MYAYIRIILGQNYWGMNINAYSLSHFFLQFSRLQSISFETHLSTTASRRSLQHFTSTSLLLTLCGWCATTSLLSHGHAPAPSDASTLLLPPNSQSAQAISSAPRPSATGKSPISAAHSASVSPWLNCSLPGVWQSACLQLHNSLLQFSGFSWERFARMLLQYSRQL